MVLPECRHLHHRVGLGAGHDSVARGICRGLVVGEQFADCQHFGVGNGRGRRNRVAAADACVQGQKVGVNRFRQHHRGIFDVARDDVLVHFRQRFIFDEEGDFLVLVERNINRRGGRVLERDRAIRRLRICHQRTALGNVEGVAHPREFAFFEARSFW